MSLPRAYWFPVSNWFGVVVVNYSGESGNAALSALSSPWWVAWGLGCRCRRW
jgi:hypothetical protein